MPYSMPMGFFLSMDVFASTHIPLKRSESPISCCARAFSLSKTPPHSRLLTISPQRALLLCTTKACLSFVRVHGIIIMGLSRTQLLLYRSRRCSFQLVEARAKCQCCVGPEDCFLQLNVGTKTSSVIPGQKASFSALWLLVLCWQCSLG